MSQLFVEHGGSSSSQDPVPPPPPELPRNGGDIFSKTKMCKFNLIGVCIKGSACMFAHHPDELKPVPDLFRTKICKTLINTGTCQNPDCRYAHNKEELRAASVLPKPKPTRKPCPPLEQPPPQRFRQPQGPMPPRTPMLPTGLPMASMDGFGIQMLADPSGLRPVGQIVPVPVAMPVGLVAWQEQPVMPTVWKQPKMKAAPAGTRRGRRGKGQKADPHQPSCGRQSAGFSRMHDQEDSATDDKMPDSFSTKTTATNSSGSAGHARTFGTTSRSQDDESSHGSSSDADIQAGMRAQSCAQEVLQEGFDTDEELLFGSQDLQYHAEQVDFDGSHGGVMVKNTFLEFEPDAPLPVLKKVHTAAGRLQELGS